MESSLHYVIDSPILLLLFSKYLHFHLRATVLFDQFEHNHLRRYGFSVCILGNLPDNLSASNCCHMHSNLQNCYPELLGTVNLRCPTTYYIVGSPVLLLDFLTSSITCIKYCLISSSLSDGSIPVCSLSVSSCSSLD